MEDTTLIPGGDAPTAATAPVQQHNTPRIHRHADYHTHSHRTINQSYRQYIPRASQHHLTPKPQRRDPPWEVRREIRNERHDLDDGCYDGTDVRLDADREKEGEGEGAKVGEGEGKPFG